jgi:hypothetical protein
MRLLLANALTRFAGWLRPKAVPAAVAAGAARATTFLDAYRKHHEPTQKQLLEELKNTAWSCASINAAVCASFPPKLYVTTGRGQPAPKCLTKALPHEVEARLRSAPHLAIHTHGAQAIEQVVEHPLLTLLRKVNAVHNAFELWELTQLYLEVHGAAYWLLQEDESLGIPAGIWILPSQSVTPRRATDSGEIVDYYEYRSSGGIARYAPDDVIRFQLPDPRDPYNGGLSPLRACFEQVALASEYAGMKRAVYDNTGVPSVVLSPAEVIGADERDRLEEQWERTFRRGGSGRVLVAESGLHVSVLSHSMGDLAALADMKATKEDIRERCFRRGSSRVRDAEPDSGQGLKLRAAPPSRPAPVRSARPEARKPHESHYFHPTRGHARPRRRLPPRSTCLAYGPTRSRCRLCQPCLP